MPQLGLYNFIDHHTDGPRYSAGLSDGYLINSQHVVVIVATAAVSLGNVRRADWRRVSDGADMHVETSLATLL